MRLKPKKLPSRIEFFTICFAVNIKGQIFYETELVPLREEWSPFLPNVKDLKFHSFDATLRTGTGRVPIIRVAVAARLFAEWRYAQLVIENELKQGDTIIRDGSLQTATTNERKYANETYDRALEKNVKLVGLSKTSALFTTTGYPLMAAIAELAESTPVAKTSWYYHPIVIISQPDHRAEMYAVKLYPRSEYVFRLEFVKPQIEKMSPQDIEQIIGTLSSNSEDASFPGYPYGLLDADRFARVSSREKDDTKVQFLALTSNTGLLERLIKCVRASNAHDIINQLIIS